MLSPPRHLRRRLRPLPAVTRSLRQSFYYLKVIKPGTEHERPVGHARILRALPRPTDEFRRRSWLAFQIALDRHLLRRRREPGERLFPS